MKRDWIEAGHPDGKNWKFYDPATGREERFVTKADLSTWAVNGRGMCEYVVADMSGKPIVANGEYARLIRPLRIVRQVENVA